MSPPHTERCTETAKRMFPMMKNLLKSLLPAERTPEVGPMDEPEEVDSFDRLSSRHLGVVERPFVSRMVSLLRKSDARGKPLVLDVGTGPANIPIRFLRKNREARMVALDLSPNMLKKAKSNISAAGLEGRVLLVCADAQRLPFGDGTFDLVVSHFTMHHLSRPLAMLGEIVRVTREGCRFLVRDLLRPRPFLLEFYVRVFGCRYDRMMRKMYRESLKAGFTFREMRELAGKVNGASVRPGRFFVTEVGMEGVKTKPAGVPRPDPSRRGDRSSVVPAALDACSGETS